MHVPRRLHILRHMAVTFDIVRDFVGEPAGPELVRGVDALSPTQLDSLAEAITSCPSPSSTPPKPVTEIWPLIPLRSSLFFDQLNHETPVLGYGTAGINLSAAMDLRLQGSGVFSDGIVRALLYCHGLLIEDPLAHAAEMHLGSPSNVRNISRLALSATTASMSEISELLDEGIVQVFYTCGSELEAAGQLGAAMMETLDSEEGSYSIDDAWNEFEHEFISGLSRPLQELWKEIREGNQSPSLDSIREAARIGDAGLAEVFVDTVRILNPRNIVQNAVSSTACSLAMIEMLGGAADIFCASPLMGRLIFLGAPDPAHTFRVHELARASVPNVSELLISDLVSIRHSSDALATWRADLSTALDYSERARKEGIEPASIQAGIAEIVSDARTALHREARKTRLLSHQNLVSFIAGALGGAGGSAVGGAMPAVAAGTTAGILASLVQAFGGQRRVPAFVDRHYVAFGDPTT